jgi:RimJ/RimL family protein N-acetyltransferase
LRRSASASRSARARSSCRGRCRAFREEGHIGSWPQDGVRLVGYWLGKEHWGKGVATRAFAAFLHLVTERPLHAHVAKHNVGSIRVLEKCGFSLEREESVEVAGTDVAELVLVLR